MSDEIALKKLEIWLNFIKFILGTFIIGLIVINVNSEIQQREITLKEQNHLAQFTQEALKENVASRLLLAQYYANVTQSTALKEGWQSYLKIVQKEYNDKLKLKKDAEKELTKLEEEKKAGQADENVEELISIKKLKIDRVANQLELPSMKQQYIPEHINPYVHKFYSERFEKKFPDIKKRIIAKIKKFADNRGGDEKIILLLNSINNNTDNKKLDSLSLLKSILLDLRSLDNINVISSVDGIDEDKEFYIARMYIGYNDLGEVYRAPEGYKSSVRLPDPGKAYAIKLKILNSSGEVLESHRITY